MSVDRQRWLEQGYLIRRNVIPPDQLDAVRASYEDTARTTEDCMGQRTEAG